MGGILSSSVRSSSHENENGNHGGYRYPPKGGGNYFSNHFIMGGEKFESPEPESFLFGENSDLNFLEKKPVLFPYPPPNNAEPTKTLKSYIHIRRDSLHLIPIKNEDPSNSNNVKKYSIQFILDSDVRVGIRIHQMANWTSSPNGVIFNSKIVSEKYIYERGGNQSFKEPSFNFTPSMYPDKDWTFSSGANEQITEERPNNYETLPFVIHCLSEEGDEPRQSHTTIAILDKQFSDPSSYVIKAVKQKIFVDGLSYLLQEIYGLENKNAGSLLRSRNQGEEETEEEKREDEREDEEDSGAECVVCMSELRDTIILPCRHLCLCNACADSLRYQANNCPICRSPFRALFQIRSLRKVNNASHPAVQNSGDDGVPSGYLPVSLVEALNGPLSVSISSSSPSFPPEISRRLGSKRRSKRKGSQRENNFTVNIVDETLDGKNDSHLRHSHPHPHNHEDEDDEDNQHNNEEDEDEDNENEGMVPKTGSSLPGTPTSEESASSSTSTKRLLPISNENREREDESQNMVHVSSKEELIGTPSTQEDFVEDYLYL